MYEKKKKNGILLCKRLRYLINFFEVLNHFEIKLNFNTVNARIEVSTFFHACTPLICMKYMNEKRYEYYSSVDGS